MAVVKTLLLLGATMLMVGASPAPTPAPTPASAPIASPTEPAGQANLIQANPIVIEYGPAQEPSHVAMRAVLQEHKVLEQFRDFLGMFVLPHQLTLKFDGCEGETDSWYEPTLYQVTICYEYIEDLRKNAPKQTTEDGVTPEDAVIGPVMEVVLHETAHALFHILDLPILGREEDAADQFAAMMLLQMGPETARRTIAATALMYWREAEASPTETNDFADAHSPPMQRFYQLVCIAYGADEELFGYVREKYLDPERADECPDEAASLRKSFAKLIGPHIDTNKRQQLEIGDWMPAARRTRASTALFYLPLRCMAQ